MSSIDLTSSQKRILSALTDLYRETEDPIQSMDIAEEVNRSTGGIRNKMQSLINLQLVEGISGQKGGYKPTKKAYDVFDIEYIDDPENVPLVYNNKQLKNIVVGNINFTNVHHPDICRAKIHIHGSTRHLPVGDKVIIGPTPHSNLKIVGTVDGKDETNSTLILQVDDMVASAEELGE